MALRVIDSFPLSGSSILFQGRAHRLKGTVRTVSSTAAGGETASYAARSPYHGDRDIAQTRQDEDDEPLSPEIRNFRLLWHANEFPDDRSSARSLWRASSQAADD